MTAAIEGRSREHSPGEGLHLVRWNCSSGSNAQSRAAVVIESGEHRWQATTKGTGPVDALFRAVDDSLRRVLDGHPRLLAYDVHAVAQGPDAQGKVTVTIAPPDSAAGERAKGTYDGVAQGSNIIEASVQAYMMAIDAMLAERHWQGATESGGNRRGAALPAAPTTEVDKEADPDTSRWWE